MVDSTSTADAAAADQATSINDAAKQAAPSATAADERDADDDDDKDDDDEDDGDDDCDDDDDEVDDEDDEIDDDDDDDEDDEGVEDHRNAQKNKDSDFPTKPSLEGLSKVQSINDLAWKAKEDPRYRELAFAASRNLGGTGRQVSDLDSAIQWLNTNAMETDEDGVIAEINFMIPKKKSAPSSFKRNR